MEEKPAPARMSRRWPDWSLVAILLLLAGGIHAWLMAHTTVAARDSIGYIRFALHLESQPWGEVLKQADQHPGYPLAILLVSKPVRQFLGGTTAETMVLSAQLASAIAGTLLVIPMFLLGRLLFDRRTGFWAAVLFQCLPVSAHVIGDAISEATYFLFLATSLLLAAQALRNRSVLGLALCGALAGLAYLTRPEGALAVFAVLVVLGGLQLWRLSRWPWQTALVGATALLFGALAVGGPYAVTIGRFSPKRTADKIIEFSSLTQMPSSPGTVLQAQVPLFAVWLTPDPYGEHKVFFWEGLGAVAVMIGRAFQYIVWLPALVGLWWFRSRLLSSPGALVLLILCGMYTLVLWRMAALVGYVSERHALTLLLGGSFWAAAMLTMIVDAVMRWRVVERWRPVSTLTCLTLLTGFALPSVLKPMHANRAGHKAVGLWLMSHADPRDAIHDPYAWAHFYAGAVFREGQPPTPGYLPMQWLILEDSDNLHERLTGIGDVRRVAKLGSPVYTWHPGPKELKNRAAKVTVYRYPPLLAGQVIAANGLQQ
jgi:hypothetical protein